MAIRNWSVARIISWAATWIVLVAIGTIVLEDYEVVGDAALAITLLTLILAAVVTLIVQLRWLMAGSHRLWHPGKLAIVILVAVFATACTFLTGLHPDTRTILAFVFLGPLWLIVLAMVWTYLDDDDGRRRGA